VLLAPQVDKTLDMQQVFKLLAIACISYNLRAPFGFPERAGMTI
jgi:hypothetical protein